MTDRAQLEQVWREAGLAWLQIAEADRIVAAWANVIGQDPVGVDIATRYKSDARSQAAWSISDALACWLEEARA